MEENLGRVSGHFLVVLLNYLFGIADLRLSVMAIELFCSLPVLAESIAISLCFLSFFLIQSYALLVSFVVSDELETFCVIRDRSATTIVFK